MNISELESKFAIVTESHADLCDALQKISDWCDAYPLDVFPEPDRESDRKLLGDAEYTCLNASSMRHVVRSIDGIVKTALANAKRGSDDNEREN